MFGYGLLAGILLLVPAFPATSLVREKVQGHAGAAAQLAAVAAGRSTWASCGGVLGFTAVLLVMTLPAAAACYALGGLGEPRRDRRLLYGRPGAGGRAAGRRWACWSAAAASRPTRALRTTYALVLAVARPGPRSRTR